MPFCRPTKDRCVGVVGQSIFPRVAWCLIRHAAVRMAKKKRPACRRDAKFRDWETLWCHEIHIPLTPLMDNSFIENGSIEKNPLPPISPGGCQAPCSRIWCRTKGSMTAMLNNPSKMVMPAKVAI